VGRGSLGEGGGGRSGDEGIAGVRVGGVRGKSGVDGK